MIHFNYTHLRSDYHYTQGAECMDGMPPCIHAPPCSFSCTAGSLWHTPWRIT